jgi:DNA repair ATPase RecN
MSEYSNARLEAIDERLDRITLTLESMMNVEQNTRRRVQQHDLELDDQDERTERLEKILLAHEGQMAELKESRADIKSMLDILLRRSIGDTGTP